MNKDLIEKIFNFCVLLSGAVMLVGLICWAGHIILLGRVQS